MVDPLKGLKHGPRRIDFIETVRNLIKEVGSRKSVSWLCSVIDEKQQERAEAKHMKTQRQQSDRA